MTAGAISGASGRLDRMTPTESPVLPLPRVEGAPSVNVIWRNMALYARRSVLYVVVDMSSIKY